MRFKIILVALGLAAIVSNLGASWIQQYNGTTALNDLDFPPMNVTTGYACGVNSLLLKTTNGGDSWQISSHSQPSGNFNAISFPIDETAGYIACDSGNIEKTVDGENWVKANVGILNNLYGIFFLDNNLGYVVGGRGAVAATNDGGLAWRMMTPVSNADLHDVWFLTEQNGFVVGDSGTIAHTTDGGRNWELQRSNVRTRLLGVYFFNENKGWVVGAFNTLLKTRDGGQTWDTVSTQVSPGTDFYSIAFPTENFGIICGSRGRIVKTTDAGFNWALNANLLVNFYRVEFPGDSMIGWVCGMNEAIYKTNDAAGIEEDNSKPMNGIKKFYCQPNPFRHHTSINFSAPKYTPANLTIYDCAGNFVRTIVMTSDGIASWDGTNEKNQRVSPGVYLLEYVNTNRTTEHLKLTILE